MDYEWSVTATYQNEPLDEPKVPEINPFSIVSDTGNIVPGHIQKFTIKFSPLEIHHYEAKFVAK